ncbi:MAG: (2Fe-2S)-binding protein [Planctomycetes bacterium]|nr:(2Fe-2S)-binding protein [Planctomycetota bacterium]
MDLVEVAFTDAGKTVFVPPGTTLLAAAGMAGVDVATGCTRGMCGTDAWRVDCGAGELQPAAEPERSTLQRMGTTADCRLLCSARVQRGRVAVTGDAVAG